MPADLEWPDADIFNGSRTEIYKLRNSRNAVVGIASRIAASNNSIGNVFEWVLHLPARGSMYVTLDAGTGSGGRKGQLRAGTREFAGLAGSISERWVADTGNDDGATAGRIELLAKYVAAEPLRAADETE
ncbi:MAG: hypothetical protein HKN77_06095 [Woeseiaceae bacterium]|nr:hypothetical protein [Woeseiaceae bacterium]